MKTVIAITTLLCVGGCELKGSPAAIAQRDAVKLTGLYCYTKDVTTTAQKCQAGDIITIPTFQAAWFCDWSWQIHREKDTDERVSCVYRGETREHRPIAEDAP